MCDYSITNIQLRAKKWKDRIIKRIQKVNNLENMLMSFLEILWTAYVEVNYHTECITSGMSKCYFNTNRNTWVSCKIWQNPHKKDIKGTLHNWLQSWRNIKILLCLFQIFLKNHWFARRWSNLIVFSHISMFHKMVFILTCKRNIDTQYRFRVVLIVFQNILQFDKTFYKIRCRDDCIWDRNLITYFSFWFSIYKIWRC